MDDKQTVTSTLCPDHGKLNELLNVPQEICHSIRNMKLAAIENPDDGPLRMSYPGFRSKSFYGGCVAKEFFGVMDEEGENIED